MSLMKNYRPSQVSEAYTPTLQIAAITAFPTVIAAKKMPDVPLIRTLAEAYDEDFAVEWVRTQLFAVNTFAGVKSKLSDMQLGELAIQIRLEYGYLNLFEFILFCARLRSGKYEEFYGSVDPMRILKSLDAFISDRNNELYKERIEQEKVEQMRAEEEHRKNAMSFDKWYLMQDEEARSKIRQAPYFARLAQDIDERIQKNEAKDIPP